jgi:hypothetical protein
MDDVWIENIFSFYFYPIDGWLAMYQPSTCIHLVPWYLSSVLCIYLPTLFTYLYITFMSVRQVFGLVS